MLAWGNAHSIPSILHSSPMWGVGQEVFLPFGAFFEMTFTLDPSTDDPGNAARSQHKRTGGQPVVVTLGILVTSSGPVI